MCVCVWSRRAVQDLAGHKGGFVNEGNERFVKVSWCTAALQHVLSASAPHMCVWGCARACVCVSLCTGLKSEWFWTYLYLHRWFMLVVLRVSSAGLGSKYRLVSVGFHKNDSLFRFFWVYTRGKNPRIIMQIQAHIFPPAAHLFDSCGQVPCSYYSLFVQVVRKY